MGRSIIALACLAWAYVAIAFHILAPRLSYQGASIRSIYAILPGNLMANESVSGMTSKQPTLGAPLRRLRSRNDWTLKEMSQRIGISVSTLSKVERDRLTLSYDKLLQLIPVLTRVRARNIAEFGELVRHAGEEYRYVIEQSGGRTTLK